MHSMSEKTNGSGEAYLRLAVLEQKLDSHMEADEKFQLQAIENQKKVEGWIEKLFSKINDNQRETNKAIKDTNDAVDGIKMPVYIGIGLCTAIPTAIEIFRLLTGK